MKPVVSILGCGWLGFPLAQHLQALGYVVKGSTTSEEKIDLLEQYQIEPYLLKVEDSLIGDVDSFLETDVLIINIPYRQQKKHFNTYKVLLEKIKGSTVRSILFVSSSSVYDNTNGVIVDTQNFERNPEKEDLFALEQLFQSFGQTTVVRFAGLIDGRRHPGNFFKDKEKEYANGLSPVNLIHLQDCLGIVTAIIQQEKWGETFHAAADSHPTKIDFYGKAALLKNKQPAMFKKENTAFKILDSQYLKTVLNYQFVFDDLLKALVSSEF